MTNNIIFNDIEGYEYCHDHVCCFCGVFEAYKGCCNGTCKKYNKPVHDYGYCPDGEWNDEKVD